MPCLISFFIKNARPPDIRIASGCFSFLAKFTNVYPEKWYTSSAWHHVSESRIMSNCLRKFPTMCNFSSFKPSIFHEHIRNVSLLLGYFISISTSPRCPVVLITALSVLAPWWTFSFTYWLVVSHRVGMLTLLILSVLSGSYHITTPVLSPSQFTGSWAIW